MVLMYKSRCDVGIKAKLTVCAGIHTVHDPITAVARSFLILFLISVVDLPSARPKYEKNIKPNIGFQIVCSPGTLRCITRWRVESNYSLHENFGQAAGAVTTCRVSIPQEGDHIARILKEAALYQIARYVTSNTGLSVKWIFVEI